MDLSMATNEELSDECFLRHGLTQLTLQAKGMTMEEGRAKQREYRESHAVSE